MALPKGALKKPKAKSTKTEGRRGKGPSLGSFFQQWYLRQLLVLSLPLSDRRGWPLPAGELASEMWALEGLPRVMDGKGIHVNVRQKPPQYCKVISLQLKF